MKTSIYLHFDGNAEEAFEFYEKCFGTKVSEMKKFNTMPGSEKMSEAEKDRVMHVSLPIGKDILMGSDYIESMMREKFVLGNNFAVSLSPNSEKEARDIFEKLSNGGKIVMLIQKTFWNALFGSLVDKFGINWMINYDLQNSERN